MACVQNGPRRTQSFVLKEGENKNTCGRVLVQTLWKTLSSVVP